jgi:hypothetical protein
MSTHSKGTAVQSKLLLHWPNVCAAVAPSTAGHLGKPESLLIGASRKQSEEVSSSGGYSTFVNLILWPIT